MKPVPFLTGALLLWGSAYSVTASEPNLKTAFDASGIASLIAGGAELVLPDSQSRVSIRDAEGKWQGAKRAGEPTFEGGIQSVFFEGFEVKTEYRQEGDALNFTVRVSVTGDKSVRGIEWQPLTMELPARPRGGPWNWGYSRTVETDGAPGVVDADWGAVKVAVCAYHGSADPAAVDREQPMVIGFKGSQPPRFQYPVQYQATFEKPLAKGEAWEFSGSLRFAASETPTTEIAKDVYAKFAERYPFILNWPDRRPIGVIFLANSGKNWPTNPRGWFDDSKLDTTTPEGREVFRERMMKLADDCMKQMEMVGAQGMLFWDVEGGEMPHAITYLGDPRALPVHAPEMDEVADEFFKRFTDAGYKTGVTLRPSKIIARPGNGVPAHQQVDDPIADMSDKIAYAKKRWGCTIFYMDTNVTWPRDTRPLEEDITRGMWQGNATLITTADMVDLAQRHPDTLIFPEFPRFGYYSAVAVYGETRTGGLVQTPADVRAAYPDAATVWKLGDVDFMAEWDGLLAGAVAGDIHVFRTWFGDRANRYVGLLQQEVKYQKQAAGLTPQGSLSAQLDDQEPVKRYAALASLEKPTPADTALLLERLRDEKDWIVQRQMVVALGNSGSAEAVPMLQELATDQDLYGAATTALGKIGPAGTAALLEIASGANEHQARSALRALARHDDPAATPQLLEIATGKGRSEHRSHAIRALGKRPSPEVAAALRKMLEGNEPPTLIAASKSLGEINDRTAVEPLVQLIIRSVRNLKDNHVREAAGDALEKLTGLQLGTFENQWEKALTDGQLDDYLDK